MDYGGSRLLILMVMLLSVAALGQFGEGIFPNWDDRDGYGTTSAVCWSLLFLTFTPQAGAPRRKYSYEAAVEPCRKPEIRKKSRLREK